MNEIAKQSINSSTRQTSCAKRNDDDDLRSFKITGAKDTLNQLGSISKTEYDYYKNL